jgi:hypothetical protein
MSLERGPFRLVSTIEELLERKSSDSGLENRDYGRRGPAVLTTRYPSIRKKKKFTLTSPTSGGRSVGIVRSRTLATEFVVVCLYYVMKTNLGRLNGLSAEDNICIKTGQAAGGSRELHTEAHNLGSPSDGASY